MKELRPTSFEIYWTRRRMWIAVTWSVLVMALAVSYYFFVFLPGQARQQRLDAQAQMEMQERVERAKLDQAKATADAEVQAKAAAQTQLDACLRAAIDGLAASWDRECLDRGGASDCRLPKAVSDDLNAAYRDQRDACLKRYPQI